MPLDWKKWSSWKFYLGIYLVVATYLFACRKRIRREEGQRDMIALTACTTTQNKRINVTLLVLMKKAHLWV